MKDLSTKLCPQCKIEKLLSDFYNRRSGIGNSSYCKLCSIKQAIDRQRAFKLAVVEYLGGKCVRCGYCKCPNALECHHLDPTQKESNVSKFRFTSFDERAKKELDKCELLCSNCHREEHWKGEMAGVTGLEPA